ncbi:MAG: ACT domain-containing protein [Victivallaceae bacterium]
MKIEQLSLFLENKPGSLNVVCRVLRENNINMRTLSLADTEQFGILRLLIKEWKQAKKILEAAGYIVKVTEVLALPVDDRPGGLADVLEVLNKNAINVEYMYAFSSDKQNRAIIVFRFENPDKAEEILKKENIDIITGIDLFN